MDKSQKLILVVGATGTQGTAVVNTLLKEGFKVRILARNPEAPSAKQLIDAGAEVSKGDLSDPASLEAALQGVNAVYSILPVSLADFSIELNSGLDLVKAAVKANIQQFIHASGASAGKHESFPRWGTGYWLEEYWTVKWAIEEAIHKAGFPYWTILKPAGFMENFLPPIVDFLYPKLKEGKIVTAQIPTKKFDLVTVEDTAKFACAAFKDPEAFNKKSIDIASDSLTNDEVAATLTKVLGRKFEAISCSPEEAIKHGLHPYLVKANELSNVSNAYAVDWEVLKQYNIPLTSFEEWVTKNRSKFEAYLNNK